MYIFILKAVGKSFGLEANYIYCHSLQKCIVMQENIVALSYNKATLPCLGIRQYCPAINM
jgi:hypothetical protein